MIKCLIFLSLCFSANHRYDITLMGANTAEVEINFSDTTLNQKNCISINFKAKTKKLTNIIFPVDCRYNTIINKNLQTLSFSKITSQPGISNLIETNFKDNHAHYKLNDYKIPKKSLNIFTLLYHLKINQPNSSRYTLEREGLLYEAYIDIILENDDYIKYNLEIDQMENNSNKAIIKNTDIFTWAVYRKDAKRIIWIDKKKNRIDKCEFDLGFFTLSAKYIKND
tara:strand:+ start:668 stop:1342 length:675 start_codon:yes stop_codon:yes gene_type:complete